MTRIRRNLVKGKLGAALTNAGTTITFDAVPAFPTISGGDIAALTINDAEVVYLTAYTAGQTTGTISRGEEGTTAVAHANQAEWQHGPTTGDFVEPSPPSGLVAIGNPSIGSTTAIANNSYGPDLLSFSLAAPADISINWYPYASGTGDPCIGLRNDGTNTSWWFDAYNPTNGLNAFPGSHAMKGRGANTSFHSNIGPSAFLKAVPAGNYTVRSYKVGTGSVTLAENVGIVKVERIVLP
jgi:hypothetical protein